MNTKILVGVVVLLVVLGGGYWVFKSSKTATPIVAAQEVTVSGSEFAFAPATISVKVGQPVSLTFKNEGKYPHNFTVAGLNVQSKTIQPGQQDTVTFTPTTAGNFDFMCTVTGHADKGMKGVLTVLP